MADTKPLHQTRFEAAVSVIQSLPKNGSFQPSNEMMLKFYSFYKQATQGPCNVAKPGFWDPVGRYKWDAWNSLGDMSKEDAMIAYVDEMKKILETMPVTEKVEELLQVLGPFYEMVEDKKHMRAVVTSDLSTALTSTPNYKAVNGKAESSDSGAESEEEDAGKQEEEEGDEDDEEEGETEQSEQEEKMKKKKESAPELPADESLVNGLLITHSDRISDIPNQTPAKSNLPGIADTVNENLEGITVVDLADIKEDDCTEDVATAQHLTSDSDSEIFCDSMEQFGQDDVDHSQLLEDAMRTEPSDVWAGGEVKDGGEDGKASGRTPPKEKPGHDKAENFPSRRGRASRMHPMGEGSQGGQRGSGEGGGEGWGSERGPNSSLNEQIAVVLMRLQEDMQNVLQRLQTLEALTASQTNSMLLESQKSINKKSSWWCFDTSSGTMAFAIIWPFIAHWLIHLYQQRKRRKPA